MAGLIYKARSAVFAASGIGGLYFVDSNSIPSDPINDNFEISHCDFTLNNPNEKSIKKLQDEALQKAITSSKNLVWTKMSISAIPGLVIGVSVDGKTVWRHGKN